MIEKLKESRRAKLEEYGIASFWYFARIENLDSILENGILPKNQVEQRRLQSHSFAEESVQKRRHYKQIQLTSGQKFTIHNLVPVYFCPKTPTLSARRNDQYRLIFTRIQSSILLDDGVEFAFTDGNAAHSQTRFFINLNQLSELPWEVIKAHYWNDLPDGKRKRSSEFLIFPRIPTNRFLEFGVSTEAACDRAKEIVARRNLQITVSVKPEWFF
jgi:hypothetical protein